MEPHHSARGITRYEIAEWLAGHHHHLVCVKCGAVEDIALPKDMERQLERLVGEVSELSSFSASGHSLEVDGHCSEVCMTPAVRGQALVLAYGSKVAIDSSSFEIPVGGITALIGPNGSGKSTLLNAIAGLIEPSSGSIEVHTER